MWHRLVKGGVVTPERRQFDGVPPSFANHPTKGDWQWLPEVSDTVEADGITTEMGNPTEVVQGGQVVVSAEVITLPVEEVRRRAHDLVNAERTRRRASMDYARVSVDLGDGLTFDVDTRNEEDLSNLDTLLAMANTVLLTGSGLTFDFKDADNVYRDGLTAEQVASLCTQVALAVKARAVDWSWAVKEAIDAAEDPAGIKAVLQAEGLV